MVGLESFPLRGERILVQGASDKLVLLNLDSGEYFSLNEVGGKIWELCDGTRSVSEIVSAICQAYDAPAETVETDVLELLEELAGERLVVEGSHAAGNPRAAE